MDSNVLCVKESLKFNGWSWRPAAGGSADRWSHTTPGLWYPPTGDTEGGHPVPTVTHTPADISTAVQTGLITSHSPSYHSHQGPDHTVGRRPATGGHVLAFSRVRNTSGLISSSTSQIPGPDISSPCYCFAWALLSCPFLSTTALRRGLHSQAGCVCGIRWLCVSGGWGGVVFG